MSTKPSAAESSFAELFAPKLVTVLREGYSPVKLRADVLAGLTVAIVALPLSMAIAIASGATPAAGLVTAIVGGFLISLLGGSRHQIGGPAGAFIVLVAAVITRHGFDGLLLATFLAGAILVAIGYLRLGGYIRFIPHPVIIGFSAAIALIIFASQIRDLLGLTLSVPEPAELAHKLVVLAEALPTLNPAALALSVGVIATILGLRRYAPRLPGLLIAVAAAALLTWAFDLPVETIGSKFGSLPTGLPAPAWPPLSFDKVVAVFPDAMAIAFLAGIESLLSAVVADGMSGRRHRANAELVAQGIANMVSPLFGGLPVTGTIARTATNIRAGAVSPISGMLHSAFLLAFMLLAAPLAGPIPLAALGGVLAVVAWNMAERHVFAAILRHGGGEAAVLLATFGLTIFVDLMVGIGVGVVLGSLVFMKRMSDLAGVRTDPLPAGADDTDHDPAGRHLVVRLSGPLFFGSVHAISRALERIGSTPETLVIDLSEVPMIDGSGAVSLATFVRKLQSLGVSVQLSGAAPGILRVLGREGLDTAKLAQQPAALAGGHAAS